MSSEYFRTMSRRYDDRLIESVRRQDENVWDGEAVYAPYPEGHPWNLVPIFDWSLPDVEARRASFLNVYRKRVNGKVASRLASIFMEMAYDLANSPPPKSPGYRNIAARPRRSMEDFFA